MDAETYEFPFGVFHAHERYIVGEPAVGADMGIPEARMVIEKVAVRFTKPWGYIGNRIHNNSVDPFVYVFARSEAPLFHAMAIVAHSPTTVKMAYFEETFIRSAKLEFGVFVDLEVSQRWVQESVERADDMLLEAT